MGKDPAMPLYVNDWLSSPRVQSMTPLQELAYFRLCAFCWASGDASLPDDDEQLGALSRMGEGWLKGGSTVVRKCFNQHPTKAGFLTHQKLYELWLERQEWRAKSRIGGQHSAESRKQKRSYGKRKGGSRVVEPPHEPNGNPSSSSSSSSFSVSTGGVHVPEKYSTPEVEAAVDRWAGYFYERNNEFFNAFMRQGLYEDSMRQGWSASDLVANINGSMGKGWRTVCQVKDADRKGTATSQPHRPARPPKLLQPPQEPPRRNGGAA